MLKRYLCLLLLLVPGFLTGMPAAAAPTPFTVVIDAGHGGQDPGTLGSSCREKDIVLAIALKVGKLIEQKQPSVKVIYTRNSDVFVELNKRAIIANKAHANLFISIHADHAESPSVRGASTFTLGANRTAENMAIAKRENSVILLEDNYQQRYEGFDPTSAESYIMFEFMQDTYMNQSIQFASSLQQKFVENGRANRGVRQDVFLVLRCTSMPSVLIEVGFLSNPDEEAFLKSEEGQDKIANSIYKGFVDFKNDYDRKSTGNGAATNKPAATASPVNKPDTKEQKDSGQKPEGDSSVAISPATTVQNAFRKETPKATATTTPARKSETAKADSGTRQTKPAAPIKTQSESKPNRQPVIPASSESTSGIVFKVQVMASQTELSLLDQKRKGFKLDSYFENNWYKYTIGSYATFEEANRKRREMAAHFSGAFVVAFRDGEKISVNQAKLQQKK